MKALKCALHSGGILYVQKLIIINLLAVCNEICVHLITGCEVRAILCVVYFVFISLFVCLIPHSHLDQMLHVWNAS